jgi:hypothetical protein
MAISTYSELQTAANNYAEAANAAARLQEFIALGEAKLNRRLGPVETDTTLTGVANSRRIDISSLSIVQPLALFLAETGNDEVRVHFKTDGTFPYLSASGRPAYAAFDVSTTYIDFDRPLSSAYPFRFRYRQRFALSDAVPTNWLLTNHPDVYLAATMMWGAGYREDLSMGQVWKTLLDEAIPEIQHTIAQSKRGTLTVDPALAGIGGGRSDNSEYF